MRLESKIEKAIDAYSMKDIYEGAIIGFSGGADSSAILHYLKDKTKNLLCVHINHMIRGTEALRDELFCRSVCERYGVKYLSFRVDVPNLAKERRKGLEETAREERYKIFNNLLSENKQYKCIVTAHNANDNAETIIFNLTRGTGPNGILGIKPTMGKVVRPLILADREDILAYCEKNNVSYVTDSTNMDTDYTRNYIRHEIIPQLKKINRNVIEACSRLSDTVKADQDYFDKVVNNIIEENNITNKIDLKLINSLDYAVKTRLLKRLCDDKLDYKALKSCVKLLYEESTGKLINLTSGISLKIERGYAHFIKTAELKKAEFLLPLVEGVNEIPQIDTIIAVGKAEIPKEYKLSYKIALSEAKVCGRLYARNKLDGDTIYQGRMTKKLKRILTDKHVPSHKRDKLPVICDEKGVIALANLALRDGVAGGDIIISVYSKATS